jgi:hypothetical protein
LYPAADSQSLGPALGRIDVDADPGLRVFFKRPVGMHEER